MSQYTSEYSTLLFQKACKCLFFKGPFCYVSLPECRYGLTSEFSRFFLTKTPSTKLQPRVLISNFPRNTSWSRKKHSFKDAANAWKNPWFYRIEKKEGYIIYQLIYHLPYKLNAGKYAIHWSYAAGVSTKHFVFWNPSGAQPKDFCRPFWWIFVAWLLSWGSSRISHEYNKKTTLMLQSSASGLWVGLGYLNTFSRCTWSTRVTLASIDFSRRLHGNHCKHFPQPEKHNMYVQKFQHLNLQ